MGAHSAGSAEREIIINRFQVIEDIGKDFFGIAVGIPDHTFRGDGKRFSSLPEKRDGLLFLVMVGRKCPLMKRKF